MNVYCKKLNCSCLFHRFSLCLMFVFSYKGHHHNIYTRATQFFEHKDFCEQNLIFIYLLFLYSLCLHIESQKHTNGKIIISMAQFFSLFKRSLCVAESGKVFLCMKTRANLAWFVEGLCSSRDLFKTDHGESTWFWKITENLVRSV